MNEVQRSLGRIEGKQDQILDNQIILNKVQGEHKNSINRLENRQHWYAGGIAAGAFVIVFFKDFVHKLFA